MLKHWAILSHPFGMNVKSWWHGVGMVALVGMRARARRTAFHDQQAYMRGGIVWGCERFECLRSAGHSPGSEFTL